MISVPIKIVPTQVRVGLVYSLHSIGDEVKLIVDGVKTRIVTRKTMFKKPVLVVQVLVGSDGHWSSNGGIIDKSPTFSYWRDARVEDLFRSEETPSEKE